MHPGLPGHLHSATSHSLSLSPSLCVSRSFCKFPALATSIMTTAWRNGPGLSLNVKRGLSRSGRRENKVGATRVGGGGKRKESGIPSTSYGSRFHSLRAFNV